MTLSGAPIPSIILAEGKASLKKNCCNSAKKSGHPIRSGDSRNGGGPLRRFLF